MFRHSSIQALLVSVLMMAVFVVGISTTEAAHEYDSDHEAGLKQSQCSERAGSGRTNQHIGAHLLVDHGGAEIEDNGDDDREKTAL